MAEVEGISTTESCKKFVNPILPTAEGKTHVCDEQRQFEEWLPAMERFRNQKD